MKYQKWNIGAPLEEDVAALREAGYPYLMALVLAACVRVSRVGLKALVKGLKPVLFIIIFTGILNLFFTPEEDLQDKVITEYFSDEVLNSNFWLYWRTMFAFENWHSALEMKRYITRFVHHVGGLPDFSALRFTRYNQYESMILPMVNYLKDHGVDFRFDTHVTDVRKVATEIRFLVEDEPEAIGAVEGLPGDEAPDPAGIREQVISLTENDLVFITPGSLVAHSSFGSQNTPARYAPELTPGDGWDLWKKIAAQSPAFGRPEKFCAIRSPAAW